MEKSSWDRGCPTTGTRVQGHQELVARHDEGLGQRLGKDCWALYVALSVAEAAALVLLVLLRSLLLLAVLLLLLQKLALAFAELCKPVHWDGGQPCNCSPGRFNTVGLRPSGMLVRTMSRFALLRAAEAGALHGAALSLHEDCRRPYSS